MHQALEIISSGRMHGLQPIDLIPLIVIDAWCEEASY